MIKSLKTWAKCGAVALIENQLPARLRGLRALALPAAATPRGVVPALFSLPLCVTPCAILAQIQVKK